MSDIEALGMEDIAVACRRRAQESSSYRTTLLDAADEIERLRRVLEEQAKDAERWSELESGDGTSPIYPGKVLMLAVYDPSNGAFHEVADYNAAVDAAIAAGKESK